MEALRLNQVINLVEQELEAMILFNPSYFSPSYYRVFGEITNDVAYWTSVYNRGYDILEKAANPSTGLVPDWSTSAGVAPALGAAGYVDIGQNFFYNAMRTPVRTALDYLWYCDLSPRALAYNKKINSWLKAKHPDPGTPPNAALWGSA